MALGGYRFAGYTCSRPSGYTDGDTASETGWALIVHKTRIKAFMESCKLSGAQWTFNHTAGQIAFEDYGNVIYRLDDLGYNYASFFRYGNEDAYYLILTAGYYSSTGSADVSVGKILIPIGNFKGMSNTSNQQTILNSNCLCSISYEDFSDNVVDNFYDKKCLLLTPVGALSFGTNPPVSTPSYNSTTSGPSSRYLNKQKLYFGCAVKEKSIINFASFGSTYYINVSISSIDGLSSLSSPDDHNNIFSVSLIRTGSGEADHSIRSSNSFQFSSSQATTLTDIGKKFDYYAYYSRDLVLSLPTKAFRHGTVQEIPFEAPSLCWYASINTATNPLNANGIDTKGTVNIDLIATNSVKERSTVFNYLQPVANANYLALDYTTMTNLYYAFPGSSSTEITPQYYIGWDPSNPDITVESAWTVYGE